MSGREEAGPSCEGVDDRIPPDDRPQQADDRSHSADDRPPLHHNIQSAASQLFCNPLRVMVSQNRRRYKQQGFNLDLTYITDRIIAMGYPADTTEALYRNSMSHIVKFLEYYHPGHYKVFNLRGQYVYDTNKFHNRVLSFEMVDHHPPRLELMAPFCREVHAYLQADPRNVVAVHCKAGKGRTGVMICAYLVYINFYPLPRQNMDYYSIVRTHNNKGVTIPSQRRYVYYFSHLRSKALNYMPLRIELVGIYLERPPRVSSTWFRGALNCRVANGDVDVFLGEEMELTKEQWDEEEAAWAHKMTAKGEDSYGVAGGDCVSRRAYGWTVPAHRRVFLQGDVRIDIFAKQRVKVLNISQDRKKIGHVWMNTMFACPGFCNGVYQHGDEAYPYPPGATTIAYRRTAMRPKSGSASVPSSPPNTPKARSTGSMTGRRAPSFDARKTKTPRLSHINHVVKKIADVASRNNGSDVDRGTIDDEEELELQLVPPPGLNNHCPSDTLPLLYGNDTPPRVRIEQMLREAHLKNLISDSYNERRLSVPQEGTPVEKAPIGRPVVGGPHCIMRERDEHVHVFSVLEVDRAFKNKDVDPGFNLIVITRCLSENPNDQRLAEKFLAVTFEKQEAKDSVKKEKVEARQRKLQAGLPSGERVVDDDVDETCHSSADCCDSRRSDPYLKKFFYRQRADSISKYPTVHYRCSLRDHTTPTENGVPSTGESMEYGSMSELDMEVRSYHPEDSNWLHSGSSSTSSVGALPP